MVKLDLSTEFNSGRFGKIGYKDAVYYSESMIDGAGLTYKVIWELTEEQAKIPVDELPDSVWENVWCVLEPELLDYNENESVYDYQFNVLKEDAEIYFENGIIGKYDADGVWRK